MMGQDKTIMKGIPMNNISKSETLAMAELAEARAKIKRLEREIEGLQAELAQCRQDWNECMEKEAEK